MHLPVVDFSSPTAAQDFCRSLHETGFGVLRNHPLEQSLVEGIYAEWLAFFHTEAKHRYLTDPAKHDGYFPPSVSEIAKNHTRRDLKEFFHIYTWGQYPSEVSGAARSYYDQGKALAATLLNWVEEYSPPEVKARYSMPLPQMLEGSNNTLLRVLHYPPLRGDEEDGAVRAAAHGDINLLTILPAATEPGLQVLGKDDAWHDVPCDFGLLIVNIGDMLEEASGGYGWTKSGPRLTVLMKLYIKESMEKAARAAVNDVNKALAKSLETAARDAIHETAAKLKIAIST